LALGAVQASIETKESIYKIKHAWANDYEKDSCATYSRNICPNNPETVICSDVRQLSIETLPQIDAFAYGFPCNDFGGQEPLNGQEIQNFCTLKYHTTFPVFNKIHVKGNDAAPLYQFLSKKSENGTVDISPKWNFQKYLVDKNGHVIDYYLSTTSPTSGKVKKAIEELLSK
jgi:glutathione peroxidase